jgi:hypothetical protein
VSHVQASCPLDFDQLGEPPEYRPPAERVIEGDVVRRNWDIDSAKDGKVRAGVFGPFELLGRRPDVDSEGFGIDPYGRAAALRLEARPAT